VAANLTNERQVIQYTDYRKQFTASVLQLYIYTVSRKTWCFYNNFIKR